METIKKNELEKMINVTNKLLLEHDQIKKQIKSNFETLQNELKKNESEINLFLLYEVTYIKTTLYKQINKKIRFYIQAIKQAANN